MLNPQLNIEFLRQAYANNGLITIQNILKDEVAVELQRELAGLDWYVEVKDQSKRVLRVPLSEVPTPQNLLSVLLAAGKQLDRDHLFFMRLCANTEEFNSLVLKHFSEYLNSGPFLEPVRTIVGRPEVGRVWVEATGYDKCCFLGEHRDDHHPENLVAFVINLTPQWRLDWGGILMVQKSINTPPVLVPPVWNSLSMFDVPVNHLVSSVSPAATQIRYSLTGWLRP